ncbi:hypothetical protein SDC9_171126 [bioreactor metagenome]|uniref:Uncharacterized protein n=1 Tax=bioreactor metagenome TaxID=1076179 RepID=A0A645GJ36_9ZZZZ
MGLFVQNHFQILGVFHQVSGRRFQKLFLDLPAYMVHRTAAAVYAAGCMGAHIVARVHGFRRGQANQVIGYLEGFGYDLAQGIQGTAAMVRHRGYQVYGPVLVDFDHAA